MLIKIHRRKHMKKIIDIFLRSFMTGVAIAVGGTVYLSCGNKYLGAFLFGTGLFVILSFGFNLFTGKVGYAVEREPVYLGELGIIWLGNFAGAAVSAFLILQTRIAGIGDKAKELSDIKLSDGLLSIFILAFFCGILMFIAADGNKNIKNPVGQILAIFLPVVVFIISGFEHCIANMYYFTLSGSWSAKALGYMMIMTLGNAAGGMLIPLVKKGFIKAE
ncbi:formate/nitrite transporter family protein [uncultured Ruminococcus sp.]|uniref:formate/nitrite transporter family protein n=1 Tax=uncultured Ruminococcus sp. TaxID=165186 RepID=UPI00343BEA0B